MRFGGRGLTLFALAAAVPLAAQDARGAFIVTLGHDTIVVERYQRNGTTLEGDMLIRGATVIQRHYVGTLKSDGTMNNDGPGSARSVHDYIA